MSIVKILAPVTGSDRDLVVLATAFALAKPFDAHVEALFIHPDSREAVPVTEMPMSPSIIQELVDTAEEVRKTASKTAKAALAHCAGAAGVKIVGTPCKSDGVSASYRELTGHLPEKLEEASRLADVIVFPPIFCDRYPRNSRRLCAGFDEVRAGDTAVRSIGSQDHRIERVYRLGRGTGGGPCNGRCHSNSQEGRKGRVAGCWPGQRFRKGTARRATLSFAAWRQGDRAGCRARIAHDRRCLAGCRCEKRMRPSGRGRLRPQPPAREHFRRCDRASRFTPEPSDSDGSLTAGPGIRRRRRTDIQRSKWNSSILQGLP